MKCLDVQKMIIPFVNDKLSKKDLERFLNHLDDCESCREEYDVYYTLLMGMRLLDEEDNIARNFHLDAGEKLRYATEYLQRFKIMQICKWGMFIICIVAVLLFFH